ncbi:aspartate-semialdehyde dehydrogenase [Candidatus Haliotispira prima]|uniref:aspartate-semialdehyde dehydrogenase n=1 Tax=Candidatus Haliotispira prima TaxID=3034016 RepID=A0ABY8MDX4_9SPIO|nr:aspartate-semialdehyde dehydrogenase [Candidatus Haliotispira prima]
MNVGIVGVSGAVGETLLALFERHEPETTRLQLFGSKRSAGRRVDYQGSGLQVQEFGVERVSDCEVLFLCVSGDFAKKYARELAKRSIVIDNSSALRYDEDVPLLVAPVNAAAYCGQRLLANANCSTAVALMALAPLEALAGIESVQLATYQAASGAGRPAMDELVEKTSGFMGYGVDDTSAHFRHNLAYNVIPQIDQFQENGYTKEEMKLVWELQKIMQRPDIKVSATCVRVPTLRSHAEAITVRLRRAVSLAEVREAWGHGLSRGPGQDAGSGGLRVVDEPGEYLYPMPLHSSGQYAVEVGRLRHNLVYGDSGLDFFVSGDQLLRGAALNAYEIYCLTQGRAFPSAV